MRRASTVAVWSLASAVAFGSLARHAECQAAASENVVDIHGFGGWAAGYTGNDNVYPDYLAPIASNDIEVDNAYFTLNVLARPAEKFTIHAQPTWSFSMNGRDLRLDLVYAEMTLAKGLLLRAGKIKNPLGIYTEIFKVGTLRPFYLLPNAFYRLAPESYAGVGLNRVQPVGRWELELDLLAGQMDFEPYQSDLLVGFDASKGVPKVASLMTGATGKDMFGGGLLIRPPVEGLEIGLSAYSMKLFGGLAGTTFTRTKCGPATALVDCERQKAYSASIEYVRDKISLRAEALTTRGYLEDDNAYLEAAYKLTDKWQIAATYDWVDYKKPKAAIAALDPLRKHKAAGFGLNYWFNPKLVWKLDYYRVSDNRAARPFLKGPMDAANSALTGKLENKTDVVIAGLHFSF